MASEVTKLTEQMADVFSDSITKAIFEKLTSMVPSVKEIIADSYDLNLVNVVTDRNSRTRPENYKDEFMRRVEAFNFIEATNGNVKFTTPDSKNFDFSGSLRVLETILEGVIGVYVEVDEDQYKALYGKKNIPIDPLDASVSSKDRIYLLKYNAFIKSKEKELKTKFVRYPFSNTPPIDIFASVDKYVSNNLSLWISEGIDSAKVDFIKKYKRGIK